VKKLENNKGKRIIIEPVRIYVKKNRKRKKKEEERDHFCSKNKETKECSEIFAITATSNIRSIPHEGNLFHEYK